MPIWRLASAAGSSCTRTAYFARPVDRDLRDARDLRHLRRDEVLGVLVDLVERQRRRGHGQREDGLIGRVHLPERRRRGQVGRQLAGGGRDGRLDVERRRIDVAVEVELQGDLRVPERAGRGHRVQAGDRRELLLERRRHRRRHRLRAGAGQTGGHLNRGEIDVRQIADGQGTIAEDAEEQDRQHQQAGHDRPADEEFREIHDPASSESLGDVDPVPGDQAHLPVGDDGLAGREPFRICGLVRRRVCPTLTWRASTVMSGFTTKT